MTGMSDEERERLGTELVRQMRDVLKALQKPGSAEARIAALDAALSDDVDVLLGKIALYRGDAGQLAHPERTAGEGKHQNPSRERGR